VSETNRRAVGFGFVVTGILVLLVKWASYLFTETIYNSNYEYMQYIGYAITGVGVVYLIWAEISSLRRSPRSEDIWAEIDSLRERARSEGSEDAAPKWSDTENTTK
jgi:hypothetical protein